MRNRYSRYSSLLVKFPVVTKLVFDALSYRSPDYAAPLMQSISQHFVCSEGTEATLPGRSTPSFTLGS